MVIAVWLQYVREWRLYEVFEDFDVVIKSRNGANEDMLQFVNLNDEAVLALRKNVKIL